jgi:Ca2+-binding EF-hand superfamily protein
MLTIETERQLAEIFIRMAQCERQVEETRYYLSSNLDFDPYSSFKALDRLSIGSLSTTEIQNFLEKHHSYCTSNEAYLVVKQYDSNLDGRLSIEEFFQLTLPSTKPGLRNLAVSRYGVFSPEVEYLLAKLLHTELQYHRNLETAKKEIALRPDFSLAEAFRCVDIRNNTYIDRLTLINFLRRHAPVTEDDVDAIFRRIDNDADEFISYLEFLDSVMPTQSNYKSSRFYSPEANRSVYDSRLYGTYQSVRNSSPLRSARSFGESLSYSTRIPANKSLNHFSATNNVPLKTSTLRSSPLRSSPLRSSPLRSSPLRSSPLRSSTLRNPTFSSTLKSLEIQSPRNYVPVRDTPRNNHSSPLRQSFGKTSPLRSFNGGLTPRNASNSLTSFNRYDFRPSQRKSSPLRRPNDSRSAFTQSYWPKY